MGSGGESEYRQRYDDQEAREEVCRRSSPGSRTACLESFCDESYSGELLCLCLSLSTCLCLSVPKKKRNDDRMKHTSIRM